MTIEEKARAYDEALKRARALRQEAIDKEYAIDYVKDYEAIFPELAESEDERIRKWLIDYFSSIKEALWIHRDITYEQILAYLEKQKEFLMPNSTELIEMWDVEKETLKEKDFRDDAWRLAYNAFMDGFARGTCVKFEKQKEPHYTKRNALFDKCVENCDPEVIKKVSDEVDGMLEKEQN